MAYIIRTVLSNDTPLAIPLSEVYGTRSGKVFCVGNYDYCQQWIRKARARHNRKVREQAYKDLGLVKVRGALGGTYWE